MRKILKDLFEYYKHKFLLFFKKTKPKIYLAGTTSEFDYRKTVKLFYGDDYNLIDPLDSEYSITKTNVSSDEDVKYVTNKIFSDIEKQSIVDTDLYLIDRCDILIAYIQKPTFGTVMEVFYSSMIGKKTYIIDPTNRLWNDIWLSTHSDKIFENIKDCFKFLDNKYMIK